MHHSEHHGHGFNFNGDYSGEILIQDDMGNEWPPTTLDAMINVINNPDDIHEQVILPFRAFVAEAIRTVTISVMEQMSTDEVLASPIGKAALAE